MKIISYIILLPNRSSYCLLEEFSHSLRVKESCPIYHEKSIYIGDMWNHSWKPLGFNRGIVYG